MDRLDAIQREEQNYGPVETWLKQLSICKIKPIKSSSGLIVVGNLWTIYRVWEDENYPGRTPLSRPMWWSEFKRLVKTDPQGKRYRFCRDGGRRQEGTSIRYVGRDDTLVADRV